MRYIAVTNAALLQEFRGGGVVDLEKNHQCRVFCSPQFVKLAMCRLAVIQELLTRLEQVTLNWWVHEMSICHKPCMMLPVVFDITDNVNADSCAALWDASLATNALEDRTVLHQLHF